MGAGCDDECFSLGQAANAAAAAAAGTGIGK